MAEPASQLPSQPQNQPPTQKTADISVEVDLALDIPGTKNGGLWTVRETNLDGNVVFTRPLQGGGFETHLLAKQEYARIRKLPQNIKRIKTKRAFHTGQILKLAHGDTMEVQAFDAGEKRAYVRGTVNGASVERWVPSKELDSVAKNESGSSEKLQEALQTPDTSERGMFSGGHLLDVMTEDRQRKKSETATAQSSPQPTPPATQVEAEYRATSQTDHAKPTPSPTNFDVRVQQTTKPSPSQSIAELRAELREQRSVQQGASSVRVEAFVNGSPEEQQEIASRALTTLLASTEAHLATATKEREAIANKQRATADRIEALSRPLQQALIDGDTDRAESLTPKIEALNQERSSLNGARTAIDTKMIDLEADRERMKELKTRLGDLPPTKELLPYIERAVALPPRVAVAISESSEQPSGEVTTVAQTPEISVAEHPTTDRARQRISIGVPSIPSPSSSSRTQIQGTPHMPVTALKPLQMGTVTSGDGRTPTSSSETEEYSTNSTPSAPAIEDPFDLKTKSASKHLSEQQGVHETGDKTEAEKAADFQVSQQRARKTAQQFLGLPEDDILGQSSNATSDKTEPAGAGASSTEELEWQQQLELEQAQTEDRATGLQEDPLHQTGALESIQAQKKQEELVQSAFNKLKLGSKGASVTVVLAIFYLLILHIQIINEIWPHAESIPPAKTYEKVLCVTFDLLILVTIMILLKLFLMPFEAIAGVAGQLGVTDFLSLAWSAIWN